MQFRGQRMPIRAVVILVAIAALGSLTAIPANAQNYRKIAVRSSISSPRLIRPQAVSRARAFGTCTPGSNTYDRFTACGQSDGTVTFLVDGEPVGTITFLIDQTDQLAAKSTTVTESVSISNIVLVGETEPTELGLTAACGSGCTGDSHAPVALTEGASYQYDLNFVNSVGASAVSFNTPTYTWEFSSGQPATTRGLQWRCDSKLNQAAGCVYASFVPTIYSLAGLKFISASIRSIQAGGGPNELHRNSFLGRANRSAVCNISLPPGWAPPAGWPLPLSDRNNQPTCDEYPFARSWEGGARLPASERGTAWVPSRENSSQGGLLNAFYLQNRVLDALSATTQGDAFYVAV